MSKPNRYWSEYNEKIGIYRIFDREKSDLPKVSHYIAFAFTKAATDTIVKALNNSGRARRSSR